MIFMLGALVLVTGHTGFKGSWLTIWLRRLGANVVGFSLPEPPTTPDMYSLTGSGSDIVDVRGDIRDYEQVLALLQQHRPETVFHLSAQPIVLRSVKEPKLTFDTNAGGTINILEAIRNTESVRALVSITTDKVYADEDWLWGYRETDRLGGHDPYSASKAMAELAIASYRDTYFPAHKYDEHGVGIASVRAGNVIGGGDFADFRLVPDCIRALMAGEPIGIRNPSSIRPWQHVLAPLSGYLWVGTKLLQTGAEFGEAWNFAPPEQIGVPARDLADKLIALWGSGSWVHTDPGNNRVETGQLRLSWEKAASRLGWHPVYDWVDALTEITTWFKAYGAQADMLVVTQRHIDAYVAQARIHGVAWAS